MGVDWGMKCDFLQTRILSVFNLLKRLGFAVLFLGLGDTFACTTGWVGIGSPPWPVLCAISDPATGGELAGTHRDFQFPNGGGVFAHSGNNMDWEYRGLSSHRVFKLSYYPYCRENVFASTDFGLYAHNEDTLWTLITSYGTPFLEQLDFSISPHDTSLWLIVGNSEGSGWLFISRNSGESWNRHYLGNVDGNLIWSRTDPDVVYFREQIRLSSVRISDSTAHQILISFPGGGIHNFVYHPTEEILYVANNHSLGKVELTTNDTLVAPLPQGVNYLTSVGYTIAEGLLVGTSDGLYSVSDDLTEWYAIEDSVATRLLGYVYISEEKCIAGTVSEMYVTPRPSAVPRTDIEPDFHFTTFPNPFNSTLSISLDVPLHQDVTVSLYDLLGREVDVVYRGRLSSSTISYVAPAGLSSGVYFLRAAAGERSVLGKVVLLK